MLWRDEAETVFAGGFAEEVGLHLTEGIAHLHDGAERRACGVGAEIEGDGIEDVAEHAGQGDEAYPSAAGETDAVLCQISGEVFLHRGALQAGEREVVAVAELVKIAAVAAQERDARGEGVDLVEVEREHEDAVAEAVLLRRDPVVHDAAFVEAGVHDQRGSLVMARAHSSALVKPSS